MGRKSKTSFRKLKDQLREPEKEEHIKHTTTSKKQRRRRKKKGQNFFLSLSKVTKLSLRAPWKEWQSMVGFPANFCSFWTEREQLKAHERRYFDLNFPLDMSGREPTRTVSPRWQAVHVRSSPFWWMSQIVGRGTTVTGGRGPTYNRDNTVFQIKRVKRNARKVKQHKRFPSYWRAQFLFREIFSTRVWYTYSTCGEPAVHLVCINGKSWSPCALHASYCSWHSSANGVFAKSWLSVSDHVMVLCCTVLLQCQQQFPTQVGRWYALPGSLFQSNGRYSILYWSFQCLTEEKRCFLGLSGLSYLPLWPFWEFLVLGSSPCS